MVQRWSARVAWRYGYRRWCAACPSWTAPPTTRSARPPHTTPAPPAATSSTPTPKTPPSTSSAWTGIATWSYAAVQPTSYGRNLSRDAKTSVHRLIDPSQERHQGAAMEAPGERATVPTPRSFTTLSLATPQSTNNATRTATHSSDAAGHTRSGTTWSRRA